MLEAASFFFLTRRGFNLSEHKRNEQSEKNHNSTRKEFAKQNKAKWKSNFNRIRRQYL